MGHKHIRKVFPTFLLLILSLLAYLSGPFREAPKNSIPFFGNPVVELSGQRHSINSEVLRAVISSEDIPALSYFKNLRQADFRGSSCFDEIYRWSLERPETEVIFSVPLPTGETVDSNTSSLDLSRMTEDMLDVMLQRMKCLPNLRYVKLGLIGEGGLSASALDTLKAAAPNASFDFSIALMGKTLDFAAQQLDLSSLTKEELGAALFALPFLKDLKQIELGNEASSQLSWDDIKQIKQLCPSARLNYSFTLYGRELTLDAEELDYRGIPIEDEGQAVRKVLPCMNACARLDMDNTGVSNESMALIRDENPNTEVIWRIWFGDLYSVRTDTVRVLASIPSVGGIIYDADVLKYCTKMKYLDIGHNQDLVDASFLSYMPELEVLIIADTGIRDISALANCPKLDYLEIFSTEISDISVLENCKLLRHLNIGCCPNITDISMLYGITEMERLWIGNQTPISEEQVAAMRQSAPNCNINVEVENPHDFWRYTDADLEIPVYYWVPRYEKLLLEELLYQYREYSFYWLDPLYDEEAPLEYRGIYGKEAVGA